MNAPMSRAEGRLVRVSFCIVSRIPTDYCRPRDIKGPSPLSTPHSPRFVPSLLSCSSLLRAPVVQASRCALSLIAFKMLGMGRNKTAPAVETESNGSDNQNVDVDPLAVVPKTRWERIWPALACGSGLFSDGYINNVRRALAHFTRSACANPFRT